MTQLEFDALGGALAERLRSRPVGDAGVFEPFALTWQAVLRTTARAPNKIRRFRVIVIAPVIEISPPAIIARRASRLNRNSGRGANLPAGM
jgi:hypothetical protein